MITETRWGSYEVIAKGKKYKVKILIIKPGCGISYQKHMKRTELWQVVEGEIFLARQYHGDEGEPPRTYMLTPDCLGSVFIGKEDWHQLWNFSDKDAKIVEIQYGDCKEKDIKRKQYEWIRDKRETKK